MPTSRLSNAQKYVLAAIEGLPGGYFREDNLHRRLATNGGENARHNFTYEDRDWGTLGGYFPHTSPRPYSAGVHQAVEALVQKGRLEEHPEDVFQLRLK